MTRDEVMALSDIELNEKSLDLLGDTSTMIGFFIEHGWDPTHDIAAAWGLGAYAQKLDDEEWHGRTVKMAEFFAWNAGIDENYVCGTEWAEDPIWCLRSVLKHLTARAITRAFILAMADKEATD